MAYRGFELKFQVVLLGPPNAGKTTIIKRIKDGMKDGEYIKQTQNTLGHKFYNVDKKVRGNWVKLQLVDTAGMERNANIVPPQIYKKANAVGFVYDITEKNALEELDFWIKQVDEHCKDQEQVRFVAGNKSDEESRRQVTRQDLQQFAREKGIGIFGDISAKSGDKFNTLIDTVLDELLSKEMKRHKIIIVGASQVGKTKLVNTLRRSEKETSPTKVPFEDGVEIKDCYAHIIDTPGKEPHLSRTPLKEYSDADGFVFVFDCTSPRSFNIAKDWFNEISALEGRNKNMQFMVIANNKGEKYAQNDVVLNSETTREFEGSIVKQVNANDPDSVTEAFDTLCQKITTLKWAEDTKKPVTEEPLMLQDGRQKSGINCSCQ